jgi:hypothetical protein
MRIAHNPFGGGVGFRRSRYGLSAHSDRREMIGLLGSLLIFLMGVFGRSETWVGSATTVIRHLIQLVLVFLGLLSPAAQTVATPDQLHPASVHMAKKRVPHVTTKPMPNSMMFRTDPRLHRYNYIFEGKASFHGEPCPNASVLVRVESEDLSTANGTVTEADGSYRVEVAIDAADHAPVDWTMEAYTADFHKVELSGRRIVQKEEEEENHAPIIVTTPVEFVVSLSK